MLPPLSLRMFRLCCLVVAFCSLTLAQPFPALETYVATDSESIDLPAINQAAQRLADKGVKPFVIFMESDVGESLEEASGYLDRALESYGLRRSDGALQENLLALFVGTRPLPESDDQRPIFIVYEDKLFPALSAMAGSKDVDTFIREDLMIPKLRDGNFTGAFVSVFESLWERLGSDGSAGYANDPAPTPEATTPEVTRPNVLQQYWWLGLPVIALVAFFGLRSRPKQYADAVLPNREADAPLVLDDASRLKALKTQLATLTAELEPSLPNDPKNQTEMVLLAGYLETQDPEALAQLNRDYAKAVQQLKTVTGNLSTFTQTGTVSEQLPRYQALLAEANEVKAFTASLNDRWQQLNRELASVPDKLAAMRGTLQQLRASYKERPDFVTADEVFGPLEQDISEVESVQQQNKSLEALRLLTGVQDNIALVSDSVTRLMEADQRLDSFEATLPQFQAQGFKLFRFAERIPDVRQSMEIALRLIKQGEYKVLDAQVDDVMEQTSDVVDGAKTFSELHKHNADRLESLENEAKTVVQQLEDSAKTFTAFQAFAASSWRDVRGNGTEAQNALNRAQELWENARADNDMVGPQEFDRAKTALDNALSELAQAKTLLAALDTRLHDLQTAKATAKDQLALVEKDLAEFQTLLRRPEVDKDVGHIPEQKLTEAKVFVDKAKAELSLSLPDWLVVMKNVQCADKSADEALSLMRSEQEAMEHRRVRVNSERVEAQSALQRVSGYLQAHQSDMTQLTLTRLEELNQQWHKADAQMQSANELSEEHLAQTLEQTATLYDGVQQQADTLFLQAEKDFNDLENLRKQVAERLAALQSRLNGVNSQLMNAGLTPSPLQRKIYEISNNLPVLTNSDRTLLENADATLQRLEPEVTALVQEANKDIDEFQDEQRYREESRRARDTYSWGGFGVPSPPRDSSPWWGSASSSSGSSWSSRSSSSSSSRSSSSSSRSNSSSRSSSSNRSSWGGSGKKSGGGW